MSARRADWILIFIGAAIGVSFGALVAFTTMLDDGPTINPVQCRVSHYDSMSGVVDAKLEVDLFGQILYTRAARQPEDLETESTILKLAAPASVVLVATLCGFWVGSVLARLFRRRGLY